MCGIAGLWSRASSTHPCIDELASALKSLRHRGPDDEGILIADSKTGIVECLASDDTSSELSLPHWKEKSRKTGDIILGHRRLSILDLSPAGHQPMPSQDERCWITFNGEIFNYIELRDELRALGHEFKTGTDTEVILASWREWGKDCLHRFNGDWAFAILDLREPAAPCLFLARDRYGFKPLFFSHSDDGFWFASEIKALLALGASFSPNEQAVRRFLLSGELPPGAGTATFFEGISQLRPGESIMLSGPDAGQIAFDRWYDLTAAATPEPVDSPETSIMEMESHLTQAVRLRLRADVPVGSCLSGGVDSSAVVGTMRALQKENDGRVHSFSAVYHDEGPFNERRWIDEVVTHSEATPHFVFPDDESLAEAFDRLVWHQDEPFQTASIFAQWCVMEKAREDDVTVLLDGQAADELLAGYQPGTYQEQFLEWIQTGQKGRFFREWNARRQVTGISWATAIRELWQILLLGTTGVLRATQDWIDPRNRLASLGFREDQIAELYSGQETDYAGLRVSLEEDLEKEAKWKDRLRKHPEEANQLNARLSKKRKQIVSRRIKLARFRDQGSVLWRLNNDWRIIRARIAGEPEHRLCDLLLAQTTTSNLQHLLRFEDRNSMAHAVEARVPFTDHRLVEWAFSRANDFKIRNGWTKWPLRKATADRVPKSVLWRSDKVGFETPDLKMAQRLLAESPRDLENSEFLLQFLQPEAIVKTMTAVKEGPASTEQAKLVWRWLVLESWHRQFSEAGNQSIN